jgi:hypothetical protein
MKKKILITAPVRQDIPIFKEYLWSLNRLNIPSEYEVHRYFYLHNSEKLKDYLAPDEYQLVTDDTILQHSDYTHIWKDSNLQAAAAMRTMALEKARIENYDYVFSVDSDIILRKNSLADLLGIGEDVVAKIFWTATISDKPWQYYPNCYEGRYTNGTAVVDYDRYKKIGIHETGVTGACILISRNIFSNEKVNYFPLKNVWSSKWEDYAFSIRVHTLFPNIKFYVDTRFPVKHLYREEDYQRWMDKEKVEWVKRF